MKDANSIPYPSAPIDLSPCEPTRVVATELSEELAEIGPTCRYAQPKSLQRDIDSIVSTFSKTDLQSFGFFRFDPPGRASDAEGD